MAVYAGKVMFTYGCGYVHTVLPNKRARERFAEDLLRLSRCESYLWRYQPSDRPTGASSTVEWTIASNALDQTTEAHAKATSFTITLRPTHPMEEIVASDCLDGFEKKMRELASASLMFLPVPTVYYGNVALELSCSTL